MRACHALILATMLAGPALAQAQLTPADRTAAFRAAGFQLKAGKWQACGDPGSASYTPGAIESVTDMNGDGRPEAVVTEGSVACFGESETGYTIVGKQADGSWKRITDGQGIVTVLTTTGVGGWKDIEVGGPGFCFPVLRWNGRAYAPQRYQYEGKPCRPTR